MLILKTHGNCTLNWIGFLQFAFCLLVGKAGSSSSSSNSRTSCVVQAVMTDRHVELLDGNWNDWRNNRLDYASIQTVPHYRAAVFMTCYFCAQNPSIIPLQLDYPTDGKTVIECLYWDAATGRILNQNIHHFCLCYDVFLVELCGLGRYWMTVSYNSPSFEVPRTVFWSVFWVDGWSRYSSLLLCSDDSQGNCPKPQRIPHIPNISQSSAIRRHFIQGQQAQCFNLTNPMSKNTQCMAFGYNMSHKSPWWNSPWRYCGT